MSHRDSPSSSSPHRKAVRGRWSGDPDTVPPFKADSPGLCFCHLTAVIVLIVPELRIAASLAAAPSSSHAPPCVAQVGSPHTKTLGLTVSSPGGDVPGPLCPTATILLHWMRLSLAGGPCAMEIRISRLIWQVWDFKTLGITSWDPLAHRGCQICPCRGGLSQVPSCVPCQSYSALHLR